jgi:hypothetical protein
VNFEIYKEEDQVQRLQKDSHKEEKPQIFGVNLFTEINKKVNSWSFLESTIVNGK